jgi:predicted PurR-regulated permease PerM
VIPMKSTRPLIFWIVTFALVAATVVLLHHVLLPFIAAATLAYLLDPVVNRLERVGMNRASATLFITGLFIVSVVFLLFLGDPYRRNGGRRIHRQPPNLHQELAVSGRRTQESLGAQDR